MSAIALRPWSRRLPQRSNFAHRIRHAGCQRCRYSAHGGFQALKNKLPALNDKKLYELSSDKPARTRFAPSPTGYLHLGSLRTALFNWLVARATGGQFIIRVEDTDRNRIVPDSVNRLLADLKWAELNWDEGPDVGGSFGPYEQSKRLNHYQSHINHLIKAGKAYRCFCTAEDLEHHKQQSLHNGGTVHYPGTCRAVPPDQAERRAAAGEKHVVRFRSEPGLRPSFVDKVYGTYQKNEDENDFILIKTDGYPTYHFANVVDDHLMEITHVIRGAEWLISTPKHIALYDAFRWEPPTFAHAGLLCANGEKLSKRNQDVDISYYRERGILPSALNNWLVLLGWSPSKGDLKGDFIPTLDELAKKFSLKLTKGNININLDKLASLQRKHMNHQLRTSDSQKLIDEILIDPINKHLAQISHSLSTREERTLSARDHSNLSFSTKDFTCLTPSLENQSTMALHLSTMLRTLSSESDIAPLDLIYEHPSLFLRPSPAAYERSLADLASLPGTGRPPRQLLADLHEALAAVPEEDWMADHLQHNVINHFSRKHAESEGLGKPEKPINLATYALLRLVLTGDPNRGAKPARLQLALLGRMETMCRFKSCLDRASGLRE